MTFTEFKNSLSDNSPPTNLSLALQGLWHDGKNDWEAAHNCAQDQDDKCGAWVHAYLHRKEGDLANAGYWYRQADQPICKLNLEEEWAEIVCALL